jgi:hypothetical protein
MTKHIVTLFTHLIDSITIIRQACYLARKGDYVAAKALFQSKEKTCSQHSI